MEGYKKKILWNYQTGNYIILTDGDIKNKRRKDMKKRSSVIISVVLLLGIIISMGDIPDFVVIPFMCNIIIIISASIVEFALAIVGGLIASTLKTVTAAGNAIRQGELIVQNEINDSFNIIPGFNMLEIRIFESGQNVPPVNNRMYKSQFYSSSIRYLYFELHYSFSGSTQSFPLNYQIFKNNKEKEFICNVNTGIELLNAPDGYNWFGWDIRIIRHGIKENIHIILKY